MPVDLKAVDPAVVKAESKQERPRPKVLHPTFTFLTSPITKTENGFTPEVNAESLAVHTSDNKYFSVPRSILTKMPIKAIDTDVVEFAFSGEALTTVAHWCEKFGASGSSGTQFALPITHTDFTILLTSDWEKSFFSNVLSRHDGSDVFIPSINAAEALGLTGLLDFLIAALSCSIRGKSDSEILTVLHSSQPVDEAEIAVAKKQYSWFADATAPKKN